MRKALVFTILLIATAISAAAQEVVYSVDFNTTINNREGGDEQTPDQTFIFTRLNPEVGVKLVDDNQGTHLLKGGVVWYQPMHDGGDGYKVVPTLYYQYVNGPWDVAVGAAPRRLMHVSLPTYMWSDSLGYSEGRVRGLIVNYTRDQGAYLQGVLDWRQMQTTRHREAFDAVVSGGVPLGRGWWMTGHLRYNHLAKRKNAPDTEGVNDDGTINPLLTYKHDGNVSWQADAGVIWQLQRCRAEDRWHTPLAFIGMGRAQWRWLEVKETVKAGKDLFPLYEQFGSQLNLGDPYYRSRFYSRTDATAHLVRNRWVDLATTLSVHVTDKTTGFWQELSCHIYFDNNTFRKTR